MKTLTIDRREPVIDGALPVPAVRTGCECTEFEFRKDGGRNEWVIREEWRPIVERLYAERHRPQACHSDIWEHLPTLRSYAARCSRIVEIGVRSGNSTVALLAGLSDRGGGILFSYDIGHPELRDPQAPGVTWQFTLQNTHAEDFRAPACDLLFIDGDHKYAGVKADLRHAENAARWIIMHDTDEERDHDYGDGVCRAMNEFLDAYPGWFIRERFFNCNGLTVLERNQ